MPEIFLNNTPFTFEDGDTILDLLQREQIAFSDAQCGGNGTCGKCNVSVLYNGAEQEQLACKTLAKDTMRVSLPQSEIFVESASQALQRDDAVSDYALAVDIGTTTVVCYLLDRADGEILRVASGGNAQRVFGADVISRIESATEGNLQTLKAAITEQLNGFVRTLCGEEGIEPSDISYAAIAGNTVMLHLLTGMSPETIGVAPFTPLSLFGDELRAEELGLSLDCDVCLLPAVSGYVGGDITAGVYSSKMHLARETELLVDIGTNGEMVLGSGDDFICCATAAGPAFEGAGIKFGTSAIPGAISKAEYMDTLRIQTISDLPAIGVCGSGLVDAIKVMLQLGVIDETGRILDIDEMPPEAAVCCAEVEDETVFLLSENVYITPSDVRNVQLAKSAIAAGIEVLADERGIKISDISRVILAGGFGSYINKDSACKIGLLPPQLAGKIESLGNTAGAGAIYAAVSKTARDKIRDISSHCKYIELSNSSKFSDYYIENMMF